MGSARAVREQPSPIEVEHLDTPRLVADGSGTTVWTWDQQEPFGDSVADENPGGLGNFDLPLRLPGQRYDQETGLYYNYYRDCYDPALGRYCEGDPLTTAGLLRRKGFRPNGESHGTFASDVSDVPRLPRLVYVPLFAGGTPNFAALAKNSLYEYGESTPLAVKDLTGEFGVGGAAIVIGGLVVGGTVYLIYDCASKCRAFCPIPNTPDTEFDRENQIFKCKLDCVKALGGLLETYGYGDATPTRIDPILLRGVK